MSQTVIYQGTDEKININLYNDEDQTDPINIDDLSELYVYLAVGNTIIGQWNKAGSGDFSALTRTDEYTYYLWLETNSTTKLGTLDLWIATSETNAELTDDLQDVISVARNVLEIKEVVW